MWSACRHRPDRPGLHQRRLQELPVQPRHHRAGHVPAAGADVPLDPAADQGVLLNILSVCATFGATVLFWQDGHGSQQVFGIPATGAVSFWLPVLIFAFLFGLSMDYEVFILARMREEYDRTGNTRAVVEGLGRTGRLVTGAATILFLSFVALAASPGTDIKVFATALGIGILLDATIVRALLVPALVALFGKRTGGCRTGWPRCCGSTPEAGRSRARTRAARPPWRASGSTRRRSSSSSEVAAQRVVRGHLDQHDPHSVGVGDPALDQAPWFGPRLAQNLHARLRQAGVLGVHVAHLQPQRETAGRSVLRSARDLQQAVAEEEHRPRRLGRPELAGDGQTEGVAVEAHRGGAVGGVQQDPAAQYVHAGHAAGSRLTPPGDATSIPAVTARSVETWVTSHDPQDQRQPTKTRPAR